MSDKKVYVIGHHKTEPAYEYRRLPITPPRSPADYYKIGTATDVKARLSNLSVGTPHELSLVTTIESDDPTAVESELHSMFQHSRQSGEWFKLLTNDVNSLKGLDRIDLWEIKSIKTSLGMRMKDSWQSLYLEVMEIRQ